MNPKSIVVILIGLLFSSCVDEEMICEKSGAHIDVSVFKVNKKSEYFIKMKESNSRVGWTELFSTPIIDSNYPYCDGLQIDEIPEKSIVVVNFDNKNAISYNDGITWKVRSGR